MSKQFDLAQEVEQRQRDEALARFAEAVAATEPQLMIDGVRACLDCFEPLTKKRLEAKPDAVRCVECQALHEEQDRRKR